MFRKNVGDYSRNTITSVRQLGAKAQRLEWWENCIGNEKKKKKTMTKEAMRNILDELDDLTLGLNTVENALGATFHFFSKNISTKEKNMLLVLEYDTQGAIFNLAYDCLIKTKENLVNAIEMYSRELEEKHE